MSINLLHKAAVRFFDTKKIIIFDSRLRDRLEGLQGSLEYLIGNEECRNFEAKTEEIEDQEEKKSNHVMERINSVLLK